MAGQIPVLIFIGPPGGGKGTQGDLIAKKFGIPRISTGELLREEVKAKTELGKQLEGILFKGGLVDDEIVLNLLKQKISGPECEAGFILDGFPRTLAQAEELAELFALMNKPFKLIAVDIDVPDHDIVKRITSRYYCTQCMTNYNKLYKNPIVPGVCDVCGAHDKFATRPDDSEEIVKIRLNEYHLKTAPVISYYRKHGELISIDGTKDIADITREIEGKLETALR